MPLSEASLSSTVWHWLVVQKGRESIKTPGLKHYETGAFYPGKLGGRSPLLERPVLEAQATEIYVATGQHSSSEKRTAFFSRSS